MDEARVGELVGTIGGYMVGGAVCLSIWLGDELGLYRAMVGAGAMSADDVASKAGCNPRLTREWLDGQAAAGLVAYDGAADRCSLSDEAALALANEESPVFVARGMSALGAMFIDMEKVKGAFQGDGGLSWGDHHPCLFRGTEWFFRTGYRGFLPSAWIPALDGVEAKLQSGARVADVMGRSCSSSPSRSTSARRTSPRIQSRRSSTRRHRWSARRTRCHRTWGLGLGAQAGEQRLREVFQEAGFATFRKATESPLNLILEAKA
jgi:hypothetical protein